METKLVEYIRNKDNIPLIWKEYLPNDVHCQRVKVRGRDAYFHKTSRCKYCMNENGLLNVIRIDNVRPKFKYYGSMKGRYDTFLDMVGTKYKLCCTESQLDKEYIGLDDITCSIIGHELLEAYGGIILDKVYKCSDRVTLMFPRDIQDKLYSMEDVVVQLQTMIRSLNEFRFSFGTVHLDTMSVVNGKIKVRRLRGPSFDVPMTEHRIGPLIDDLNMPALTVFSITRYPSDEVRHYFRLKGCNDSNAEEYVNTITKYGIPIVYYSLDFYRLLVSLMINSSRTIMDMSSDNWFKVLFLPSEHTRIVNRLEHIRKTGEKDMFKALYDNMGAFSLRCDVISKGSIFH